MTGADVANLAVAGALFGLATVVYRALPPAKTRVSAMPDELTETTTPKLSAEDEALVAEAAARMKAYGAAVADRYDTEGNQ